MISKASAERLGLTLGKSAYALITASDVMMGLDWGDSGGDGYQFLSRSLAVKSSS